jgi:hypothetical protein
MFRTVFNDITQNLDVSFRLLEAVKIIDLALYQLREVLSPSPERVVSPPTIRNLESVVCARLSKDGYGLLIDRVNRELMGWEDPNNQMWGRVSTCDPDLSKRLIEDLKSRGYHASFHWHSSEDHFVVQFAANEESLDKKPFAMPKGFSGRF